MFNDDQLDYMADLAKMAPGDKCWCGWYPARECPHCPSDLTSADKIKVWCPECKGSPPPNDQSRVVVHAIGCSVARCPDKPEGQP